VEDSRITRTATATATDTSFDGQPANGAARSAPEHESSAPPVSKEVQGRTAPSVQLPRQICGVAGGDPLAQVRHSSLDPVK